MSKTLITVERVNEVEDHPNADRLDIIQVLGFQLVVKKGLHKVKDKVVFFPPDMLIPEDTAESLGVRAYLKHSIYPGDSQKSQCRVGAIRIRGEASFGFVIPYEGDLTFGADVTEVYAGIKYEPPPELTAGDARPENLLFPVYTHIQHLRANPGAIPPGTIVRATEKMHGTNSRVGLIYTEDGPEFMCGSHKTNVKALSDARSGSRASLYWLPLTGEMQNMLTDIALREANCSVVAYGEIYGRKVQDMDYGTPERGGYRLFDIMAGQPGHMKYMDWADVKAYATKHNVPTVPLLYEGVFDESLMSLCDGPTMAASPADITCKYKGREGCVVTPVKEQWSSVLCGRMIVKIVSADYYARKDAQDRA